MQVLMEWVLRHGRLAEIPFSCCCCPGGRNFASGSITCPSEGWLLCQSNNCCWFVCFFFPNRNKFSSAAASWSEELFNHLEITSRAVNCRWEKKITLLETWNYPAVFKVEDNTCQRWIQYDCRLTLDSAWPVTDIRQPIDPNKSAMTTNGIWVNNSNGWKVSGRISLIRVQRFRCFFVAIIFFFWCSDRKEEEENKFLFYVFTWPLTQGLSFGLAGAKDAH